MKGLKEGQTLDEDKYQSIKFIPALKIEPMNCYPEPLHMRLRIVGLFERIRARMRGIDPQTIHADKEYNRMLKTLGIYRHITGITGGECRRILENIPTFCAAVKGHPKHGILIRCMKLFDWLDQHQSHLTDIRKWRDAARTLRRVMMKHFSKWCGLSVYLPLLSTHCYRFMPLHPWSTQALERLHTLFKKAKRRYSAEEKKELPNGDHDSDEEIEVNEFKYHQNTKQLMQMMKWVLARNSSWMGRAMPPKKKMRCSRCQVYGHNRKRCMRTQAKTAIKIPTTAIPPPPPLPVTILPRAPSPSTTSLPPSVPAKSRPSRKRIASTNVFSTTN
jgi:hypothetical protein